MCFNPEKRSDGCEAQGKCMSEKVERELWSMLHERLPLGILTNKIRLKSERFMRVSKA